MGLFGFNMHDNKENRSSFSISVSGVINWFRDKRIKKDLNDIKSYETFMSQSQDEKQNEE